jgi:ribosomal protein S21
MGDWRAARRKIARWGRFEELKGGEARGKKLTKERRSEIAKKAAQSRWGIR